MLFLLFSLQCNGLITINCFPKSIDQQLSTQEAHLLVAARDGKVNILQHLLQQEGVNTSIADSDGNTPLHLASMNGRFDAVKFLVQKLVERSLLSSLRAKNKDEDDTPFLAHKLGRNDIACYITREYYKVIMIINQHKEEVRNTTKHYESLIKYLYNMICLMITGNCMYRV